MPPDLLLLEFWVFFDWTDVDNSTRNAAANTLKSYLREAEIGTVGDRKIMWKQISKSTVDTKRLKTEQPDIYDSYLTTSSYRRFSIA